MTSPESIHLRRVLSSLAARLDEQTEGLSATEAFSEPRQALDRLADPTRADAVLEALDAEVSPAEAAWLAEEVQRRWAQIGRPVVDALVRVVAAPPQSPSDDEDAGTSATIDPLVRGAAGAAVLLRVEVDGLDPGWTVAWTGADAVDPSLPGEAGAAGRALWTGEAPEVTARVMGRGAEGRVVLIASWRPDYAEPEIST